MLVPERTYPLLLGLPPQEVDDDVESIEKWSSSIMSPQPPWPFQSRLTCKYGVALPTSTNTKLSTYVQHPQEATSLNGPQAQPIQPSQLASTSTEPCTITPLIPAANGDSSSGWSVDRYAGYANLDVDFLEEDSAESQGEEMAGNEEGKPAGAKRCRPCKGQRRRLNRFVARICAEIDDNLEAFSMDTVDWPPAAVRDAGLKNKLMNRIQAYLDRKQQEVDIERTFASLERYWPPTPQFVRLQL